MTMRIVRFGAGRNLRNCQQRSRIAGRSALSVCLWGDELNHAHDCLSDKSLPRPGLEPGFTVRLSRLVLAGFCCLAFLLSGCSSEAASAEKAGLQEVMPSATGAAVAGAVGSDAARLPVYLAAIPADFMDVEFVEYLCRLGEPLSSLPSEEISEVSGSSGQCKAGRALLFGESVDVLANEKDGCVSSIEVVLSEDVSVEDIGGKIEAYLGAEPQIDNEDTFHIEIPNTNLEIWVHHWEVLHQVSIRVSIIEDDVTDDGSASAAKGSSVCKEAGCSNSKKNKCGYCNSHHLDNCDDPYCNVDKCKKAGCDNPGNMSDGYCNTHHYEKARQDQQDDYVGGNSGNCKVAYCEKDAYRKGYCRYHYVE